MIRKSLSIALVASLASALPAQQPPPGGQPQPMAPGNRELLQQRIGERIGQMVRQRLGLTEAQMQKLQAANQKYEGRRRLLVDQERDIRMGVRDEMLRGDSANQQRVGDYLDRMLKLQHQRIDLMEAEQKELSAFMTPTQRAQYFAMQDQMRKRVEDFRRQAAERGGRRQMGPDGPGPEGQNRPIRFRQRPARPF